MYFRLVPTQSEKCNYNPKYDRSDGFPFDHEPNGIELNFHRFKPANVFYDFQVSEKLGLETLLAPSF